MKRLIGILFVFILLKANAQTDNYGIQFSQSDSTYIIVPELSALNVTNNFTIELWMRPNKTEAWAVLLQEGQCYGGKGSYHLSIQPDSLMQMSFLCSGNCNYDNVYKCSTKIYPGACLHVAVTYSSAGPQFYFNGVAQPGFWASGSYCGNLYISNIDFKIAAYRYLNLTMGAFYDGMLDELRIWKRVRTPAEIQANMNQKLTGNETDLILYMDMDDPFQGAGFTVVNRATATGSAAYGMTYSASSSTPAVSYACFVYVGAEETGEDVQQIKLYPVPSCGSFIVSVEGHGEMAGSMEITDLAGRVVLKAEDVIFPYQTEAAGLPSGIYMCRVYSGRTYTGRLVIE
mgnify:CR=1 FL=1